MPHRRTASLGVFLGVGGRHESPEHMGIAHFLEHGVFKGSSKRNVRQVALDIEGQGGSPNAYTSKDYTCYEASGPEDLLPQMADVITDMVLRPTLPSEELDKERLVIEEEITMYKENPGDHVRELADKALWGVHPLGFPLAGSEETLAHIGRPELEAFHRHYLKSRHILAVAGAVRHEDIVRLAESLYGSISLEQTPAPTLDFSPELFPLTSYLEERRPIEQAHIVLGYRAFGRKDPRRYALRLLSVILGESMSSRLFQEIRERRGLAYHISTDVDLFEECGSLSIAAGVDHPRREEALDAIRREVDLILARDIHLDELEQAKRYLLGQYTMSLDSITGQLYHVGESVLHHDDLVHPDELFDRYKRVTLDELYAVADSVLSQDSAHASVLGE